MQRLCRARLRLAAESWHIAAVSAAVKRIRAVELKHAHFVLQILRTLREGPRRQRKAQLVSPWAVSCRLAWSVAFSLGSFTMAAGTARKDEDRWYSCWSCSETQSGSNRSATAASTHCNLQIANNQKYEQGQAEPCANRWVSAMGHSLQVHMVPDSP